MKLEYTYDQYSRDVLSGSIVASEYIILACKRYEQFKLREDFEFKERKVKHVINFISKLKHFSGKVNGKPFLLEPWQQFCIANIFGFYFKGTNKRVTEQVYIQVGRKAGKTAFISAICLYCMIADGEGAAEIDCLANSREQARILFDMTRNYIQSVDPKENVVKRYRNQLKMPATKSVMNVLAADSTRLDGLSPYVFVCDETHAYQDSQLYDVMRSGSGFRQNPLAICISSPGFLLHGYFCYDMRCTCIEILKGLKQDDSQFSAIFELDSGDDWQDPNVWIKSNPSLEVTVTKQWLQAQVLNAINNPSQQTSVKTKNLGMWVQSSDVWLSDKDIQDCTANVDLSQFRDCIGFVGIDLASVSDLTAVTLLIQQDYKFYFKTFVYIPEDTMYNSPNSEFYKQWKREGYLTVTPGNVTDYDYIVKDLLTITEKYGILVETVSYDNYNATQFIIGLTNLGFNCKPYSQSVGAFNRPSKELERLTKLKQVVIDNNPITRWSFQNVQLKEDFCENVKPIKASVNQKIDPVIAMIMSLAGYLECPQYSYDI